MLIHKTLVILLQLRGPDGKQLLPVQEQVAFYSDFFFGQGTGGLRDYYRDITHQRVDIGGMTVGWLDARHTITEHRALQYQPQRRQAFQWGIDAARAAGVQVADYPKRVVVVNADTDWGGVDGSMLLPHSATSEWDHARAAHEYGHVLGLDDAYSRSTAADGTVTDTRYGDDHCIMSYARMGRRFPYTFQGRKGQAGPGMSGVNLLLIGGVPPERVANFRGGNQVFDLAALTHSEDPGALLICIRKRDDRPHTYWVELHAKDRWDRGIPAPRIAVHESREDVDRSFIVIGPGGAQGQSSTAEPPVYLPDGSVGVSLVEIAGDRARVRVWDRVQPGASGVRILSLVGNPAGDETAGENVLLQNDGPESVRLAGWHLRDSAHHPRSGPWRYAFPDVTLAPGEQLRVWTGGGQDRPGHLYWGMYGPVWNNRGDTAVLEDSAGAEVAAFTYDP